MRKIFYFFLLMVSCVESYGSERTKAVEYYNQTVDLIFNRIEYCDFNCEDHSNAIKIADRVYHIVYEISDDKISKEKKFDLLFMMTLFHGHASIAYRYHSILPKIDSSSTDNRKKEIINHPEFCIPIMGYKHSIEHFDFLDIDSIACYKESLFPSSYASHINDVITFIKLKNSKELTREDEDELKKIVEDAMKVIGENHENRAKEERIVKNKNRYVIRDIVKEKGLNINKGIVVELEHSCFMSEQLY